MATQKDAHTVGQEPHSAGYEVQELSGAGGRTHIGMDGPIASTHTGPAPPHSSNTPNVHQSHPASASSVTSSGPTNNSTLDVRPHAPKDALSDASIKSGVIGFGPSRQQEHAAQHAALPNRNPAENHLHPNQILGGGDSGEVTGEQRNIQPTTLPRT